MKLNTLKAFGIAFLLVSMWLVAMMPLMGCSSNTGRIDQGQTEPARNLFYDERCPGGMAERVIVDTATLGSNDQFVYHKTCLICHMPDGTSFTIECDEKWVGSQ